jgi:hypothetical protein
MAKTYQETISHAKDIFGITIKPKNLMDEMAKRFSKNEEGCIRWVKGQKYLKANLSMTSKLYDQWVNNGKIARQYFGDEMVERCWKEIKILPQATIE